MTVGDGIEPCRKGAVTVGLHRCQRVDRHVEHANAMMLLGFAYALFDFFQKFGEATLVDKVEGHAGEEGNVKDLTPVGLRSGDSTVGALSRHNDGSNLCAMDGIDL